ncbi:MAG: Bacterial export protein family 3 [Planctomycetota bacterium]
MSESVLVGLMQGSMLVALVVALPLLLVAVVSGLAAGLLQSLANVHDAAAGFAPRLLVTAIAALALMGWMSAKMVDFAMTCWGSP